MCEFYKKCPSATGWCLGKTTCEKDCFPFIFQAIDNLKDENERLNAEINQLNSIIYHAVDILDKA